MRVAHRLVLGISVLSSMCSACSDDHGDSPAAASPVAPTAADEPEVSIEQDLGSIDLDVVARRAAHTASTLDDGRVFIAGGCVVDGCSTATDETFLVSADGSTASAGPRMITGRDSHTANVTDDGLVVIAGGFPGEGQGVSGSVEIVDVAAGTSMPAQLAQPRGGHTSAVLDDGRVLVVGGWIRSRTFTATAEIIDPTDGTVTAAPDLPWAADALDAVTLADGRVLVTGGQTGPETPTDRAAIFDPIDSTWTTVGPMTIPRLKHFSVLLDDGRVLVMGGDTGGQTITASTEFFDPATLEFSPGPGLLEPRYKFAGGALTIDVDHVLIGGGGTTAELLELSTGTSTIVGRRHEVGSFATVNRLGSGDYIVIGGYDDRVQLGGAFVVIAATELR